MPILENRPPAPIYHDMDNPDFGVRVECHAGYRGEEEPRRFWLGERQIEVADILDRWHAPEHRYFKLRCDDAGTYILRHDSVADRWEMTLFERLRAD
jgi:hypothetical protein